MGKQVELLTAVNSHELGYASEKGVLPAGRGQELTELWSLAHPQCFLISLGCGEKTGKR